MPAAAAEQGEEKEEETNREDALLQLQPLDSSGLVPGLFVTVCGLEGPVEAIAAPALAGEEESFLGSSSFGLSGGGGDERLVEANGKRGRFAGWSEDGGQCVVETFDGFLLELPEEKLRPIEAETSEEGGFDVVWPFVDDGPPEEIEGFGDEVAEHLRRKGWCLIQMTSGPGRGSREGVVGAALELFDWRLPKADLEVQYMGHANSTKYAELDQDDIARPCENSLSWCDRCLTHLGLALAPVAPDLLGFELWGRHAGQVRMPMRPSEEAFLRPAPLGEDDFDAGGKVYKHADFLERRRLKALYLADDGDEGGELLLHPGPRSGLEQRTVCLPISSGKLLVFLPDLMTYTYRPEGSRSVLLQTWYVTEPTIPDLADDRVVELPAGQHGDRVMVNALQTRFPGMALSPSGSWNMWAAGTDCAINIPRSRFDIDAYYSADGTGILYTNHFAGIDETLMTSFDYEFFGMSLREAEALAPEQRNVLEVGYETIVAAGYDRQSVRGERLGVYLGDAGTDWKACVAGPRVMGAATKGHEVNPFIYMGWQIGITSSRLSHTFDLKGPCTSVDTACSSSLVALGQASRSLVKPLASQASAGACPGISRALVMGLCLDDAPATFVSYCMATMLSASGRSYTFDESANGFLRGEGCGGAFVEISDSDADAQLMMACVIGCNVNQDGRSASMTAPNGPSQQMCIKASMMEAGLRPSEISIAECHGTGTALGDPIEVGALRDVMKDRGDDAIVMTSGKANFGHMEACAGMGGITKCILMLQGMAGLCNLHLHSINPHIEYVGYPAMFVSEHADAGSRTGISGVSSFGVGGTNARADLWGRCQFGYLATTEVNTMKKIERRGATFARIQLHGQPGPGVTDKVYVVGSWDKWSSMEEMRPVGTGEFAATVALGDSGLERFRLVLNRDRRQSLYPEQDSAGLSSGGPSSMLGPDFDDRGRGWRIDCREDGGRPGDLYRITFEWDFSWETGEHRRISWERLPALDSVGSSPPPPLPAPPAAPTPWRPPAPSASRSAPPAPPSPAPTAAASAPLPAAPTAPSAAPTAAAVSAASVAPVEETLAAAPSPAPALIAAAPPSAAGGGFEHRYAVSGSWAAWRPARLAPVEGEPGAYKASARIGIAGWEEFRIIRDRDKSQVIYPARAQALDPSVPILGPDAGAGERSFAIAGPTGEIVALELRILSGSGAIEVSAASPSSGRKTWRSTPVGGGGSGGGGPWPG